MRWLLSIPFLTLPLPTQEPQEPPAELEVHEWGTFTSMVGSDGVGLEGLHHEEEALPDFVHDLLGIREVNDGLSRTKLPGSHVTQKMETPVIYFHASTPMRVRVDVSFSQGLMTQFYPLPHTVRPPLAELRGRRIDMTKVDDSSLSWDVDLVPPGHPAPDGIPAVAPEDPWHFARQVRSAFVRTRPPEGSGARREAEHYLFYRGVGRFELPLTLNAKPRGRATLHNGMPGDIPFAAALEMGPAGGRLQLLGRVPAGAQRVVELGRETLVDRTAVGRRLGAILMKALVDRGLHHDEARAMIATWSRSWFQSSGTRVLYILPDAEVERILPLRVQPLPRRIVRVLVGRLEYVTPEAESLVEHALRQRLHAAAGERERARVFLESLDRFLEPQVRRALARTDDPLVRRSGSELLAKLEQ